MVGVVVEMIVCLVVIAVVRVDGGTVVDVVVTVALGTIVLVVVGLGVIAWDVVTVVGERGESTVIVVVAVLPEVEPIYAFIVTAYTPEIVYV